MISVLQDHFRDVILDNEVTVGDFVAASLLPWARLVQEDDFSDGNRISDGFDCRSGGFERRNSG